MKFAKKSLGQNFLIDRNVIKKIIDSVEIEDRDIIEIGPGKGALTFEIIKRKPRVVHLIEKDTDLAFELKNKFSNFKNVKIYNADILKFNVEKILSKMTIIFGNLPYNISSQILVKMIKFEKWPPNYSDLIFMFQKELGEKIVGKFLSPNYGRLSILCNYRLETIKKFNVSSSCFNPKPKVNSMVIHFNPIKKSPFKIKKIESLEKITNILFSNKRKMINKNIKKIHLDKQIIKKLGLKLNLRPSEIKPDIFYKITEYCENR